MTQSNTITDLSSAHRDFRDRLVRHGMLIPTGIDGLYGRGADYEAVFDAVDRAVWRTGIETHRDFPVQKLRFPPIFPREAYEKTDYIASFPHLTGAISTFTGTDADHRALLADRDAGVPWDGHLEPAGTMLVSAACHPLYPHSHSNFHRAGHASTCTVTASGTSPRSILHGCRHFGCRSSFM